MHKIGIISLGCPKNLADMESVLSRLLKANSKDLSISLIKDAKIVFLNTCGFLKAARDEVFENLENLKNKKVILLGCLAGTFKKSHFKKYPQLYAVVTSSNYAKISQIFDQVVLNKKVYAVSKEPEIFEELSAKTLLTPKAYAYVKIAEGCNNRCSYCLIPYLKGRYRSRKMESIVNEIDQIIKLGTKEIILVAQDCGAYGTDLYGKLSLADLLKKITKLKGDFWVRILYVYPERITEELLKIIATSSKICKYLDMPLQHGDPTILKKMNRFHDVKKIYEKIANIRKKVPNIALRTSLITGFPGETEDQFENLLKFIKEINFDHVGVFEYSREKGTQAAILPDQISPKVKASRREKAMILQQKISLQKNKLKENKTEQVLIENYDKKKNVYIGRSQNLAPEIDGIITIKVSKTERILPCFSKVKITKAFEYDLEGVLSAHD